MTTTAEKGRFRYPWGVAVAPTGCVYVAEWGTHKLAHRIQVFYCPDQCTDVEDIKSNWGEKGHSWEGLGKFSKVEDVAIEDWDRQLDVNLRASFLVSQAFIPGMKQRLNGTLAFMNSVAGKKGYPYSAAYVASKYGMRGLADSLREELREDNIKVISIHPGAVDTPFWDGTGVNFPREEMLSTHTLAQSIVHAIQSPGNFAVEELVVRRTAGDF